MQACTLTGPRWLADLPFGISRGATAKPFKAPDDCHDPVSVGLTGPSCMQRDVDKVTGKGLQIPLIVAR